MRKHICSLRSLTPLLLLLAFGCHAQQVFIDLVDGSIQTFSLEEIRSKEVDAFELRLSLWDGSDQAWALSEIRRYRFNDISTNVANSASTEEGLKVFPNPSSGSITVALPAGGDWSLEIHDARGALIHGELVGESGPEGVLVQWAGRDTQGHEVAPGAYVCRAISADHILTTTIVIDR
jgi:hypothetical protein